jgi:hypothetical protein
MEGKMTTEKLTRSEEIVLHATFKETMMRAAEILDHITDSDVQDAQMAMHAQGVSLAQLAKIDRAMIGAAHLRACAQKGKLAQITSDVLLAELHAREGMA